MNIAYTISAVYTHSEPVPLLTQKKLGMEKRQVMAVAPDKETEFEKMGIQFKVITEDMYPQVADFMWENFFPDEPVCR